MGQDIYKKEYSYKEILSESWKLFKENFRLILIITLLVYAPITVITSQIQIDLDIQNFNLDGIAPYLGLILLLGIIELIATMAIAYAIKSRIDGKSIDVGEAIKKAVSRLPAAFWTNIIVWGALTLLFLLLIIPGVIYSIYWQFVIYAVVLQDKCGVDALKHSKSVVKGRWWRVAAYNIIFGIMANIVWFIFKLPYSFVPDALIPILDLFINVPMVYFVVVYTVLFINFDSTKKEEKNIKKQNPPTS